MDERSTLTRHTDLRIPVGDETVAANRYEPPDGPTPGPAVLMYIPYHKDDFITYGAYNPLLEYIAHHGYHVVIADIVGTGASTGVKELPLEPAEGPDAATIVEWIAEREWCDGHVGMVGKSYGGLTCLKAAAENPEHLDAIVPIHAPQTAYRDITTGGAFAFHAMGGHWTALVQALQAMPPTYRDSEGRWAAVWSERLDGLRAYDPWLFQFMDHEARDEYWESRDITVEAIRVPTLAVSGWRDGYPQTTIEYVEAIDAPTRLVLGPWRHIMPHRGRESAIDFRRQVVTWLDHFLKGAENEALDGPPIQYWTERDGGGIVDGGVWRGREEWPRADESSDVLMWTLTSGGLVSGEGFEGRPLDVEYEVDHTVGVDSFDQGRPTDTTPDDVRSLTFESDPLDRPIEVTGTGTVRLRLVPTTPDPVVSVRLIDVHPDGEARLVSHAELQASRHTGVEVPTDLVPGEETTISLKLKPTSHVFKSGHRLRVAIAGAWFPAMCPTPGEQTLTVRSSSTNPAVVRLPGREHDGEPTFDDAVEMAKPDTAVVPTVSPAIVDSDRSWSITREQHRDKATVASSSRQVIDLPHAERMTYSQAIEAAVVADDPTSATLNRRTEIEIVYPTETVRIGAENTVSQAVTQAHTTVSVNDRTIFDETWTRL